METPERWRRIEELFQSALEMDQRKRSTFLDEACADDQAVRSEVESLLSYSRQTENFIETPALAAGTIGPYRLIRIIASGGMGVVYEAEQRNPRRSVALKVMRGDRCDDPQRILLFQREAESLARLKHPGIAAIHEAGCAENGRHYLAMELVYGEPLTKYVRKRDIPIRERLELFKRICDAISYAHQRGVIHRDLKPSNILVCDGTAQRETGSSSSIGATVKVLDFGLARIMEPEVGPDTTITGIGQIVGTLRYMSPEQARGKPEDIDIRTDVYSLGVVLYELLTDRLPYETDAATPQEALRVICEDQPVRPSLLCRSCRGDLEVIALKALEKDPQRRYQSVSELAEDIDRTLTGQPILAHPPSSLYQLRKLVGRHKVLVAFGISVFVLTLAFGIVASVLAARLEVQRQTAVAAKESEATAKRVSDKVANILDQMLSSASPEIARGKELTVREVVDEAASRIDSELADQPRVAAAVHDTLGRTYHSLGLNDKAESHLRAGLNGRRALFGEQHPDVLRSMNNLAMLLIDAGKYTEAKRLCEQALRACHLLWKGDHALTATSLNTSASLLLAEGHYPESKQRFREALAMRRRLFGNKNPDVATSLNNLAALLSRRGRYKQAEALYRESLRLRTELLGEDHPDVANSMNNLGMLLWNMGNYADAEPLLERVLALQRRLVGEDHQLVAAALNNLALLRKAMGRLPEAEAYYREALVIQRKVLGPDHPDLAETMNNLATLLYAKGDLTQAEPLLRDALEIRRATLGADHPAVAKNLNDLAALLYARRDYDAAEKLYRESLAMYTKLVGKQHPRIGGILNNLGSLMRKKGRYVEAQRFYEQSIKVFRETLPRNHPYNASPLNGLGRMLADRGDLKAAVPLLRQGLGIQRKALPAQSPETTKTEAILSDCLIRLHQFAEAERVLQESYARLRAAAGKENIPAVAAVLDRLILLYESWEEPNKAAEYRALRDDVSPAEHPDLPPPTIPLPM